MNVLEAIKTRRTIRKYEGREVPREALLRVLEAATWAPSHHDSQPWEFHLLTGEKIRALSSIFTRIRGAELEGSDMPPAKKEARMEFARTLGGAPLLVAVEVVVADEEVEMEERMQAVAAAI
ncbi:MAG: nitroreductase family protein, partial [Firmicutes bacterium]|nr:nitroreductase family protein [Bacillota bacterium]